jgi:hypothetical protein
MLALPDMASTCSAAKKPLGDKPVDLSWIKSDLTIYGVDEKPASMGVTRTATRSMHSGITTSMAARRSTQTMHAFMRTAVRIPASASWPVRAVRG